MKKSIILFCLSTTFSSDADLEDLLITEVTVIPTEGEFIEIHNAGLNSVDLSDVYLTDATFANGNTFYYQIVENGGGGGGFLDFYSRFPTGSSIAAGEYQTIALNGSTDFVNEYGVNPTYEMFEDAAAADSVPDMLEARTGSINGLDSGLSDAGEVVVLLYWDGQSDLVQDLDYVLWGDKDEAIDKTGISIDGPDINTLDSTYTNDTPISSQTVVDSDSHGFERSWQRIDLFEITEILTGGNGINGNNETSENLSFAFEELPSTPNAAASITIMDIIFIDGFEPN